MAKHYNWKNIIIGKTLNWKTLNWKNIKLERH